MRTKSRSFAVVTALAVGLVLGVAPAALTGNAIEDGTKVCAAGEVGKGRVTGDNPQIDNGATYAYCTY